MAIFGSSAGGALDDHLAAVIGDDPPAFRQAKAQSAAGFAPAEERVEDVLPHFVGDAGAVVAHGDFGHDVRRRISLLRTATRTCPPSPTASIAFFTTA